MNSYLGIDAGGSGSRWALLAEDGTFGASGASDVPIQVSELGVEAAARRVAALHAKVTADAALPTEPPTVVGLAGVGVPRVREEMEAAVASAVGARRAAGRIRIVEDTITGAAAALAEVAGVAVFAGTGSFAIGRDGQGRLHRVGGRGSVASDHGSGYRVVRAALEAALLAMDEIGPETALANGFAESFDADSPARLGSAIKQCTTKEIAARFPDVVRMAAAGDRVAAAILRDAAMDLSRLARATASRAGLEFARCPIWLGGGTMRAAWYVEQIEGAFRERGCRAAPRPCPRRAEQGAALLARAADQDEPPLCRWLAAGLDDG